MTKEPSVASSMPSHAGMRDGSVRKDGQMAPIMHRTVYAPFMVWMANQLWALVHPEHISEGGGGGVGQVSQGRQDSARYDRDVGAPEPP